MATLTGRPSTTATPCQLSALSASASSLHCTKVMLTSPPSTYVILICPPSAVSVSSSNQQCITVVSAWRPSATVTLMCPQSAASESTSRPKPLKSVLVRNRSEAAGRLSTTVTSTCHLPTLSASATSQPCTVMMSTGSASTTVIPTCQPSALSVSARKSTSRPSTTVTAVCQPSALSASASSKRSLKSVLLRSPGEMELKRKVKYLHSKVWKLKHRVKALKCAAKTKEKRTNSLHSIKDIISASSRYLSPLQLSFFQCQMYNSTHTGRRMWTSDVKIFAKQLQHESPAAYNFMSKNFSLPNKGILLHQRLRYETQNVYSHDHVYSHSKPKCLHHSIHNGI